MNQRHSRALKLPNDTSNMSPTTDKASSFISNFIRYEMVVDTRNHYLENRINGRKIKMPIFYGEDPEG